MMMSTLRQCCCGQEGPAVFISIGPDEDSSAQYSDTLALGSCNPFCLMDEDIIHPVVNADDYQIDNDFVYEEEDEVTGEMVRKVRIGLELLLRPEKNNCRDLKGGAPDCGANSYDLPYERIDYSRPDGEGDDCGSPTWEQIIPDVMDMIELRFGPQVLKENDDGSLVMNPYPSQIYFVIDTSGSHIWRDGEPLIEELFNQFKQRYSERIANSKFNPCLDGPDCASWGCCSQQECPASYCYNETGIRRFTFEMQQENYLSSTMDLMTIHFAGGHCDQEKLDACDKDTCYSCNQCGAAIVCAECLGIE